MLGCCTCFFKRLTMIGIDLAFAYVQLIIQPQVRRSERRVQPQVQRSERRVQPQVRRSERRVQPQVRRSKSLTASELAILRK